MPTDSPLHERHAAADAMFLPYGPAEAPIQVVGAFGPVELEYAALRKGCVLFDMPHRATLEITGDDRVGFLNNMLTQQLDGIAPLESRRSFWLTRQGRVVADLRLCETGKRMLADLDAHAAAETVKTLGAFIITEDCELTDATARFHRLALVGPTAAKLLDLAGDPAPEPAAADLARDRATIATIAGARVVCERTDDFGVPGFDLTLAAEDAERVWDHLVSLAGLPPVTPESSSHDADLTDAQRAIRLRPAGWLALNTARIESGRPFFNVDFAASSLPAETALLAERVDFKKGCYLGQEIVARMDSRNALKQRVYAIRFDQTDDADLPVAGAPVYPGATDESAIGIITSSTLSPMLGAAPIALATLKASAAEPGTTVHALTAAGRLRGSVQEDLAFLPMPTP